MFLKIYFDDKPLFLCDQIDDETAPYLHHDDAIFMDELDAHSIKTMIYEMQQPEVHAGVFYHPDLEALKKGFFKKFTVIQAAGGLVKNEKHEILMIFRKGKWDLPKGKLDHGESLETCAVREVEEETGVQNIVLQHPLITTYHTYHEGTKFILKESHWYLMTVAGAQQLTPQTEEGITDIQWVTAQQMKQYLPLSYPLISDIFYKDQEMV